ncbi:ABC-type Fe3+-siderophore transport system permease subunit [Chryseobacterium bernardetii]|uniref:ABC-type Fe3+-siderophore transport system permease subunit n=1 Tax=Chryseobacterium bernardetii TaxID=1241978 RepID=A0ACC6ITH9_9FLAO|nr:MULTISPECIES: hypothetical protein [Chryseobacterium]MDR6371234.1 ABC-type Fe3+-siderophore transport system permease subunit [Chryseobacterium vietnamense]MDR6441020.1 ABC-type Fe3+-siderophore transport system permease subunit [Chryseobacterium bernardetii]
MKAVDSYYVPGNSDHIILLGNYGKTQVPLNVISSVFGIPVILVMLLKQNKV